MIRLTPGAVYPGEMLPRLCTCSSSGTAWKFSYRWLCVDSSCPPLRNVECAWAQPIWPTVNCRKRNEKKESSPARAQRNILEKSGSVYRWPRKYNIFFRPRRREQQSSGIHCAKILKPIRSRIHLLSLSSTFIITNTCFKYRIRRLYTWISPGNRCRNQIDYIPLGMRWRSSVTNATTFPGADSGSHHQLLVPRHSTWAVVMPKQLTATNASIV